MLFGLIQTISFFVNPFSITIYKLRKYAMLFAFFNLGVVFICFSTAFLHSSRIGQNVLIYFTKVACQNSRFIVFRLDSCIVEWSSIREASHHHRITLLYGPLDKF